MLRSEIHNPVYAGYGFFYCGESQYGFQAQTDFQKIYIYLVRHQQIHLREKPRKVESKQRSTCASQEFLIFWSLLAAFIYGLFFYKKNLSLPRILTAKLVVIILCNIILGTYWLTLLNGKGFLAILPARAIKNLIQWPVDSLIFFLVAKTLEQAGVFKIILHAGNRQRR